MEERVLKFGDFVLLQCENIEGLLTSSGYANNTLSLQEGSIDEMYSLPNLRNCVFQVLPKLSYDAIRELKSYMKKTQGTRPGMGKDERQEDKKRLESYEQRVKTEDEMNDKIIHALAGEYVTYGQEIQLRHMPSNMLLKVKKESADADRSCFKAILTKYGGQGVTFKILSRYKIRQEGSRVLFGDRINFSNTKTEQFLHASDKALNNKDSRNYKKLGYVNELSVVPEDFTSLYEVNISILPSNWRLMPYASFRNNTQVLRSGDVIKLNHTEFGGYILSECSDFTKDGLYEVFIQIFTGDENIEKDSALNYFILERNWEEDNERGIGESCNWVSNGKPVKYKLRHLMTGRVIRAIEYQGSFILSLSDHFHNIRSDISVVKESTQFILSPTTLDSENFIRDYAVIKIKKDDYHLSTIKEEWDYQVFKSPSESKHSDKYDSLYPPHLFQTVEDDEISVHRFKLILKDSSNEEDAFILNRAEPYEVEEIEFILSTQKPLYNFAEMCYNKIEPSRIQHMNLIKILGKLIMFLLDLENEDPYLVEGTPIRRRQKYLRELKMINIFCDLLYLPFNSGIYNLSVLKQRDLMSKIVQLCYKLLRLSVKDYRNNELYCSQWMGLYLDQAHNSPLNNEYMIENTLSEMLKSNKKLLETRINIEIIERFVSIIRFKDRDERFVKLLSSLCSCNGQSITANQNMISDLLIHDEDNKRAILMPIVIREYDSYVYVTEYSDWIAVGMLYRESASRDGCKIYKYFLGLLELLAELTLDRNHQADSLKDIYTFDILLTSICSRISYDIKARMLRLMLNLHINQGEIGKLTVPSLARVWQDVEISATFKIAYSPVPIPEEFLRVKSWTLEFLQNIREIQQEEFVHLFIKEILTLTHFMVTCGFFSDALELENLAKCMIPLLDTSYENVDKLLSISTKSYSYAPDSFKRRSSLRYNSNNDGVYTLQYKRTICQILVFIHDLKLDAQITQFLQFLKRSYEHEIGHYEEAITLIADQPEHHDLDVSQTYLNEKPDLTRRSRHGSDLIIQLEEDAKSAVTRHEGMNGYEIFENTFKNTILDFQICSGGKFVDIMLQLMLLNQQDLVNEAFQLLNKLFSQRQELLESLKSIQILEQDTAVNFLKIINSNHRELKKEAEAAESWLGKCYLDPSKSIEGNTKDEIMNAKHEKVIKIIKELVSICCEHTAKDEDSEPEKEGIEIIEPSFRNISKEMHESRILDSTTKIFNYIDTSPATLDLNSFEPIIFSENEYINTEIQTLYRNLQVYEAILEIIRQKGISKYHYSSERHYKVLRYCYVFLAKFCRNNPTNQALLFEYLEEFLDDVTKNVFCLSLIVEIFRNNLKLCMKAPIFLFKSLAKAVDSTSISPKKCLILKTLSIFMKVKNIMIKTNQAEIMNNLSNSSKQNIIHLFYSSDEINDLTSSASIISSKYREKFTSDYQDIEIPINIVYFTTLIDIMKLSAEEKSAEAEIICQNLLPLPHFLTLFNASSTVWPMKKSLLLFFLDVYLDIEFSMKEDEIILWEIMNILLRDMVFIYENYIPDTVSYDERVRRLRFKLLDKNMLVCDSALDYNYTGIFPCLYEIFSKRGNSIPIEKIGDLIKEIIEMCVKLYKVCNNSDYKKNIAKFFKLIGEISRVQKFVQNLDIDLPINRPSFTTYSGTKETQITKIEEQPTNGKEYRVVISQLVTHEDLLNAIEAEFDNLVRSFLSVQNPNPPKNYDGNNAKEVNEILTALINLLNPEISTLDKSMTLRGLKLLRKIIEVENKNCATPASEWDTEDWIQFAAVIEKRQMLLGRLGVVNLLQSLLVNDCDKEIVGEVFLIGIAMLLGGNKYVQDVFLDTFRQDIDNQFLTKIKTLLLNAFNKNRKEQVQKLKCQAKSYKKSGRESDIYIAQPLPSEEIITESDFILAYPEQNMDPNSTPYKLLVNILRFLQLLCEGHHSQMQDYLREQRIEDKLHPKSFDFVTAVSGMLGSYIKMMHADNIDLGFQIIDTLTEVVQGPCKGNQRVLSQPKIIDNGRDLLDIMKRPEDRKLKGFDSSEALEDLGEIKSKAVTFLLSLLEGNVDVTILRRLAETLDFHSIKERMSEVFQHFVENELNLPKEAFEDFMEINEKLTKDSFNGSIQEGFNLFILIIKLADEYPPAQVHIKRSSFNAAQFFAYNFFKFHTGRIEVVVNTMLTRVYFPIQPMCHHITKESREELMLSVNRETPSNKIVDMMTRASDLIDEMIYNEKMAKHIFTPTVGKIEFLRNLSMVVTLFVNYMIIFSFDHADESGTKVSIPYNVRYIIYVSAIFILVLNSLVLLAYLRIKLPLIIKRGWRKIVEVNIEKEPVEHKPARELSVAQTKRILLTRGPNAVEFNMEGTRDFGNSATSMIYHMENFRILINDTTFKYFLIYIIISALCFRFPIMFAILLLDVIYRFPALRNVLAAVKTNGNQLLNTAMLTIIIVYIFTYLGFQIDMDSFYDSTITVYGESQCQNLWQCLLTYLNQGLRYAGGIGEILGRPSYNDNMEDYYERFLHDFSFFIIVIIILKNIVFGIIIDTFAELRDKRKSIEDDMRNKCFICNIERHIFDKRSYGFNKHIRDDHNVWQYIYFLVHLQTKDPTEFNGIESYCDDEIKNRRINWVPLHKAICIGDYDENEEDEDIEVNGFIMDRLDCLEEQMRDLNKSIHSVVNKSAAK